MENYDIALKAGVVDLEKLKQLAWNGVPQGTAFSI
jgi:hypothetical protein